MFCLFFFSKLEELENWERALKSRPAAKANDLLLIGSIRERGSRWEIAHAGASGARSPRMVIILSQMAPRASSPPPPRPRNPTDYRRGGGGGGVLFFAKKDRKALEISNGCGLHGEGVQNVITDKICHPNHQRLISFETKKRHLKHTRVCVCVYILLYKIYIRFIYIYI